MAERSDGGCAAGESCRSGSIRSIRRMDVFQLTPARSAVSSWRGGAAAGLTVLGEAILEAHSGLQLAKARLVVLVA